MMRRFTRRRRGSSRAGSGAAPIDAAGALERIREAGLVPATSLVPLDSEEVPANLAAIGSGEGSDGGRIVVSFAPQLATNALVAGLAVGGRLAEKEGFTGDLYVVAPEWESSARRLLGLVGQVPFRLHPVPAPGLAEGGPDVQPEGPPEGGALSPAQIAGHLAGPADRDLFARAARGLEGLAAKHGGALRGQGRSVEFVLLAKRVAELRAEERGVSLITTLPSRGTVALTPESLPGALDALEGQLRKRLNDRRVREGEEGLRANAILAFRSWHSLRALVPWPLGGGDDEILDWVGVDVEGRPVIGAVRQLLTLESVGAIVDAAIRLRAVLPNVLAEAAPPVVLDAPRLVVGGREIGSGVHRVLNALTLTHELFELRGSREGLPELAAIAAGEAPARERSVRRQRQDRKPRGEDAGGEDRTRDAAEEAPDDFAATSGAPESEGDAAPTGRGGRGRRRGRRGRGRRDPVRSSEEEGTGDSDRGEAAEADSDARPASRFDEVSLFDLDEETSERPERSSRSRGRRAGRGQGRGGASSTEGDGGGDSGGSEEPSGSGPRRRNGSRQQPTAELDDAPDAAEEDSEDEDFLTEDGEPDLAALPDDVSDFDAAVPGYEDEDVPEEADADEDARAAEREKRRRSRRTAAAAPAEPEPILPRRRGAIVAHADRDSLIAAILLARDIRMVEGLWVYPQSELMNVFRNVTTGLRDETPIYIIGFTPSPARDVIQGASLYRGRMMWFDHQDWPPEDLQALKDAIGEDAVYAAPGAGSSLPKVIECCSRRSRFTDKLVDLCAGRFTLHDYERWGRLWWWRLGQIVDKTGECRADVEQLLSGRPSDLAREAASAETPPVPPEVAFVSQRDFRLVHFAGHTLVVLEVPPELDISLAARVARERYGASLSLGHRPQGDLVLFAGDELAGKRSLDLAALVEQMSQKHDWVEELPDADHVARFRVRDLASHPERLDEIIGEIAMGRSILER